MDDVEDSPAAARSATRPKLRSPRSRGLLAGAAVVVVGLVTSGCTARRAPAISASPTPVPASSTPPGGGPGSGPGIGAVPQHLELAAFGTCDAMRDALRTETAKSVTAYGLPRTRYGNRYRVPMPVDAVGKAAASAPQEDAGGSTTPDHSSTNVQEPGVGEPDTVETDGVRVVSVSAGVLRVVDARSHQVTGRLDLTMYAGADSAQLLMAGDRLLVILGDPAPNIYGGPIYSRPYPAGGTPSSLFLLVDLAGAPSIIGTLHPHGGYVDARMIDGTARLVVSSAPTIAFPTATGQDSDAQRLARNRTIVAHAPLSAWLPTYEVSSGSTTTAHTVPCTAVSHPKTYTGASILTVYTVHLADSLDEPEPITIAADGTAVYGSTKSLYVASSDGTRTDLHRFDTSGPGRPTYLGSGTVPGQLFDSYSMSEYQNSLRVVTTEDTAEQSTSLRVLDANTLRVTGVVGGLGAGERLHAVRFLGPLAYVVTFRSVDPLYVLDLHDPSAPRRTAELTVSGYSDYLHPIGPGRLLGVGESVNADGIVDGLQISLFDSSSAQHPRRLAHLTRANTPSESPIDPRAFLYWPAAKLAVVPINSWNGNESGAALVVRVGDIGLRTVGTIRNPAVLTTDGYDSGISRTLVIGNDIWTMSSSGLRVSDLTTLDQRAWVPFT